MCGIGCLLGWLKHITMPWLRGWPLTELLSWCAGRVKVSSAVHLWNHICCATVLLLMLMRSSIWLKISRPPCVPWRLLLLLSRLRSCFWICMHLLCKYTFELRLALHIMVLMAIRKAVILEVHAVCVCLRMRRFCGQWFLLLLLLLLLLLFSCLPAQRSWRLVL